MASETTEAKHATKPGELGERKTPQTRRLKAKSSPKLKNLNYGEISRRVNQSGAGFCGSDVMTPYAERSGLCHGGDKQTPLTGSTEH